MPYRLAILASGEGTNLQALIDAIAAGALDAGITGVFSDKPAATALRRARDAGLTTCALSPGDFATREAFDAALFAKIDAVEPDLIVCAGYMRLIGAREVEARPDRMINLHPSLLPAFKGLHTHQRALAAGVSKHGASVHLVTAELDGGAVIAQARVPVLAGDDVASLSGRVGVIEHPLLVRTVAALATGRLRMRDGTVYLDDRPLLAPLQLASNRELA